MEWDFNQIEIGGYCGNTTLWGATNGSSSEIFTSKDKSNWTSVGNLPSNYGYQSVNVNLLISSGKFINLQTLLI